MAKRLEKMKYYTVVLDGIDKTGKDTIAGYIWRLDKRINIICRGWPSLVAYAKKFNRNADYALPYKDALYVRLNANEEDWNIRCSMTKEPKIDYSSDNKLFDEAFKILEDNDYHVYAFNTSVFTPYEIASNIIQELKRMNKEN